jgi:hypothetical protein
MSRWKCAVLLLAWSYCPLFAEDTEATLKEKVAQAVRMLAAEGIVGSSGHEMQITASTLGPVSRMTPAEVEDSVKESWTPNSIRKRWEYYRERDKTKP